MENHETYQEAKPLLIQLYFFFFSITSTASCVPQYVSPSWTAEHFKLCPGCWDCKSTETGIKARFYFEVQIKMETHGDQYLVYKDMLRLDAKYYIYEPTQKICKPQNAQQELIFCSKENPSLLLESRQLFELLGLHN